MAEQEDDQGIVLPRGPSEFDLGNKKEIIDRLETRSGHLKNTANITLLLILALLIGGGWVVYAVDVIFKVDVSEKFDVSPARVPLDRVAGFTDDLNTVSKTLLEQATKFEGLADQQQNTADISTPPGDELTKRHEELRRAEGDQQVTKRGLDRAKSDLKNQREKLQELEKRKIAVDRDVARAKTLLLDFNKKYEAVKNDKARILSELGPFAPVEYIEKSGGSVPVGRGGEAVSGEKRDIDRLLSNLRESDRFLVALAADRNRASFELEDAKANAAELENEISAARDQEKVLTENVTGAESALTHAITQVEITRSAYTVAQGEQDRRTKEREETRRQQERFSANLTLAATELKGASRGFEATLKHINGLVVNGDESLKKLQDKAEQGITTATFSTMGTRAAIVVILLFLVQILVTLYRYNMRLAAFYDARADALRMFNNGDQESLQNLIYALSPDQMDFGRSPSSVTEQALEFAKALLHRKG